MNPGVRRILLLVGVALIAVAFLTIFSRTTSHILAGHWLQSSTSLRARIGVTYGWRFVSILAYFIALIAALIGRAVWLRRKSQGRL
jgi:uncharacterized membrane protein